MWNAQLIGVGHYRLWTIRARYETRRQTHSVDAEVWVALNEELVLRSFDMSPPDKTFNLDFSSLRCAGAG